MDVCTNVIAYGNVMLQILTRESARSMRALHSIKKRSNVVFPALFRIGLATIFLLTALAAVSCSSGGQTPDLNRLYSFEGRAVSQPPVIVIPGILGSRLRNHATGEEVWPGSAWNLLFDRKEHLALKFDPNTLEPLDDGIEAAGLFERAFGHDFYGEILRTLEESGGYTRGTSGQKVSGAGRRYYVFAYDWRQDNVVTARKLDAFIEQVRRDYGNPKLKVDIIAHSMGGLIARYYINYGTRDVLDGNDFPINLSGAEKLHTVILLGTPNLGSADSLHSFLLGPKVGLRRIPPEVLATMPSTYELFPHPLNNWLVTPAGTTLDRDLFDVEIWQRFEWSVFSPEVIQRMRARFGVAADADQYVHAIQRYFEKRLDRARRFVWSLTVKPPATPVKLVVFGGDCTPTPARVVVEEDGGDSVVRLFPDEIRHKQPGVDYERLMLEPGDGEVTKPSLLARENLNPLEPRDMNISFPLAAAFFLCEEHSMLTGNISFQDNLLNVLLSQERPWDAPARKLKQSMRHSESHK